MPVNYDPKKKKKKKRRHILTIKFLKTCFLLRSDAPTSTKELRKLTGIVQSTTLYKSMKPKQINISEEKVSLVTEIFEKEHGR